MLADFEKIFDLKYKSYIDNGNKEKYDKNMAIKFLKSLNKKQYLEFVIDILNDNTKETIM